MEFTKSEAKQWAKEHYHGLCGTTSPSLTPDLKELIMDGLNPADQINNDRVVCPHHGAEFCIRTGAVLSPPAYEDIATFPVRVEHGTVQVMAVD